LTPACASLYKREVSVLKLLKSTFNGKIFICTLSWSTTSHFGAIHSWNVCRNPKLQKNLPNAPILGIQGHSKSSTLTFLKRSSPVLVTICSMSVLICSHFHARRANISKITSFRKMRPLIHPFVRGDPFYPAA